jgi:hypothetical protein
MDWITTGGAFIAFIIIGFILLIFMPKAKVFFDQYVEEIKVFDDAYDDIKKEIEAVDIKDANVIPIYGNGEIKDTRFPKLYNTLRYLPNVRYAGIINVKPKYEQSKQYGFAPIANHTIRHFYTIKQSAALKSGIWVDGAKKFFTEKEWILADMSREHSIFNRKKDNSIVVFIDIDRPLDMNAGNSPNTKIEADDIISKF